jgi:response regulator RpfG family c-di-GMP phosphodiesterase
MSDRILCVDDDENILAAYQRQLRKQFQIETALGGKAGLCILESGESFAVVISDLRMPEMDGIEFLAKVRQIAPDTIRMMLTGNADLQAAIEAVNQGNIFRFLTKPCSNELLAQALKAGLHQFHLITAEKELLGKTLKGAVGVLAEILSILDPSSFGRASVLRDNSREVAKALDIEDTWDLELAAMFCEIGRVTIPADTIVRQKSGAPLTDTEEEVLMRIPEIGYRLLSKIPRLESVAEMVLYQKKNYDGSGFPNEPVSGTEIPLGSRILRIIGDLNQLEAAGTKRDAAFAILNHREGRYDQVILDCAYTCLKPPETAKQPSENSIRSVSVAELEAGQILVSDIETCGGALVVPAGNMISESLRERIWNFSRLQDIREPIKVKVIRD